MSDYIITDDRNQEREIEEEYERQMYQQEERYRYEQAREEEQFYLYVEEMRDNMFKNIKLL